MGKLSEAHFDPNVACSDNELRRVVYYGVEWLLFLQCLFQTRTHTEDRLEIDRPI